MKANFFVCLSLCLLPALITAQQTPTLLLKVRPTALLDFQTPVAHIGFELRTASRFGLEIGYGLPLYNFHLNKIQSGFVDHHYGKYHAELRYELREAQHSPMFIALEAFYLQRRYQKTEDYYYDAAGEYNRFTTAQVSRNVLVACFKGVRVIEISPRWSIEILSGFGFRFRTVRYTQVIDYPLSGDQEAPSRESVFNGERHEGRRVLPHLTFGVQLAWAINTPPSEYIPGEKSIGF